MISSLWIYTLSIDQCSHMKKVWHKMDCGWYVEAELHSDWFGGEVIGDDSGCRPLARVKHGCQICETDRAFALSGATRASGNSQCHVRLLHSKLLESYKVLPAARVPLFASKSLPLSPSAEHRDHGVELDQTHHRRYVYTCIPRCLMTTVHHSLRRTPLLPSRPTLPD